jgi:oxygen-independent coproporphyrinogen III oxidase
MPLGIYISVPFCRTKCTYCNFASDVFSKSVFHGYVDRICRDMGQTTAIAKSMGGQVEHPVDSIYLGGGTPTLLDIAELRRLFVTISQNFEIRQDAEITVEAAPGTLNSAAIDALCGCGVNRVSLGVQSFVDHEAASVGRLHSREVVGKDIERLRSAGIRNISVDLIAGLPHQSTESWQMSLDAAIASEATHVSVYMLEVDEDSRLGRELIAGGTRYHAHFVPDDDLTANFYVIACERLKKAGVEQYEISNFARDGWESRHNLKYWTRQPYFGFGVDAHSMLLADAPAVVRFATPDSLEQYLADKPLRRTVVDKQAALEETFFLGLRLNRGANLGNVAAEFGETAVDEFRPVIADLVGSGLMEQQQETIRLTVRGRLLSNEVFERFLSEPADAVRR